ncbi:MAG: glycosyltransferase family 39 protein [Planctomycetota bacterium]|nr:glycosyltransferase family 39 protein [Planctomycetota bacterium]
MRAPMLWLALAMHVAFATTYAWSTPHFEGPDENSHYEYAWHLAGAGKLPLTPSLQAERGALQTEAAVLAHHPPLYYALVAGVIAGSGQRDALFSPRLNPSFGAPAAASKDLKFLHERAPDALLNWLRMTSVLLGALSIFCVHRLGRVCCPAAPRVADLAGLLVACLPMWSSLHGLLNNDVLAATLSSATTLALATTLQRERVGLGRAAGLGGLLGLAWLTKLTTLFLGGLAAAVAATMLLRRRIEWRAVFVTAFVALAVSGWWFVRNAAVHGDLLAMSAHDASFQPLPPELRWPYLLGLDPAAPAFLPELLRSLFGRFGWFQVGPHPALAWCGAVVAGLAVLGLVRASFDRERRCLPRGGWLLVLSCGAVLLGAAYFNFKVYQPQARLLFPAVAPGAVLLAAGLVRISEGVPRRRLAIWLLPAAAAAAFFVTFRPALAPQLAPAPVEHRSMVGGIVDPAGDESIAWRVAPPDAPLDAAPALAWRDDGASPETKYSLYAFDADGRVWLATHEWTAGGLVISGDAFEVPANVWAFLPRGLPLSLRLRRLPAAADEQPRALACTPRWRVTRR